MTNNEQEDYQEDNQEETATSAEETKTEGQGETKDWKAEALKYKAIAERRDKKLQKSVEDKTEDIIKTNTEPSGLTMDDMLLVQKGLGEDEIKIVKESAKLLNVPIMEAFDNEIVQSRINNSRQEAKVKSNSLPPSGGAPSVPRAKSSGEMSKEEHEEWGKEMLKNAVNK